MSNIIKLKPVSISNNNATPLRTNVNPAIIAIEKQTKNFNKKLKLARKTGTSMDVDELKDMLKTLRILTPIAATGFATYKNDRAAVALNILMNQKREVINDIRSMDNGPKAVEFIMQKILLPMLQSVMQNYMNTNHDLKSKMKLVKDKKLRNILIKKLDSSLELQGAFFNALQLGIEEKITEYLIGKSK